MRKFTIAGVILSVCLAFAGCTPTAETEPNTAPIDISEESIVEETLVEENDSEVTVEENETPVDDMFADAKEFPEIEWPTMGAATKVPTPEWSNYGNFLGTTNSNTYLWVEIGYSTLNDFSDYIELCQDFGYVNDVYVDYDCLTPIYYGEDETGAAVQLTYNPMKYYLAIQYTDDGASWSKWWEEDTAD